MGKFLVIIFTVSFLLAGCSRKTGNETDPISIIWNNSLYGIVAEVPVQEVGKEIGKIDRKTTIFDFKGTNPQEFIVIKANDKYFRASKLK